MSTKIQYPKYVFNQAGEAKKVASVDAHEALERAEPGAWAESPEHFGADGTRLEVDETEVDDEIVVPGVTAGTQAYPKYVFHADGRVVRVENEAEHARLTDRENWHETPGMTAADRQNSIATEPPAGASLWETSVPDVLEMLKGAPLETLEKTFTLEEQNPGRPRKSLLRELSELIEQAQKDAQGE